MNTNKCTELLFIIKIINCLSFFSDIAIVKPLVDFIALPIPSLVIRVYIGTAIQYASLLYGMYTHFTVLFCC